MIINIINKPIIDTSIKHCIRQRVCFFNFTYLNGILNIPPLTVSTSYAYWIPNVVEDIEISFTLTSEYESIITGTIPFSIHNELDFSLIPTTYYALGSNFTYEITPNENIADYSTIIKGGLNISDLLISGLSEEANYSAVIISTKYNYCDLIFSIIPTLIPNESDISITLTYGSDLLYILPYQNYSWYSSLSENMTIQDMNGIVSIFNIISPYNYTISLTDPRFPSINFTFAINLLYPPVILPINQSELLLYVNTNQTIKLSYAIAESVIIYYDTSIFNCMSYPGYFEFSLLTTEPVYNIMTYISLTNDNYSDTFFLLLFIYPVLTPTLLDINLSCIIGQSYSIDLHNCNFY